MLKWFTGEKTKRSGKRPESGRHLRLNMILYGDEVLPCRIDYLDREGGIVSFPEGRSSRRPGRTVRLSFLTDARPEEFVTGAIILKSRIVEGRRICRFRFTEAIDLEEELGIGVFSSFNRRRAFRVEPDPGEAIDIELTWGGETAFGRLVDISTVGIGIGLTSAGITVDLDPEAGIVLGPLDRITLSFQLPGCRTRLKIPGIIRNRNPMGKRIRYGIDFLWNESEESQRQAEAIRDYVMRQQQSMLERSAWIRRS